jgi:hypothetical protein
MYCSMFLTNNEAVKVSPVVYSVRNMFSSGYTGAPEIKDFHGQSLLVEDYNIVRELFGLYLSQTVEKIFKNDEPFRMTENLKKCDYCPFARLCQR